jgi:uncharacterized protein YuzE
VNKFGAIISTMPDQSGFSERYAYYDRRADIVWIPTAGRAERVVNEETEWGLLDYDAESDEVVGVEIWKASSRLPTDLLEALPNPPEPAA